MLFRSNGEVEIISTHDQILGGPDGQIYIGCRFPADANYRCELQELGLKVGKKLAEKGALERFAVDFVTVDKGNGQWDRSSPIRENRIISFIELYSAPDSVVDFLGCDCCFSVFDCSWMEFGSVHHSVVCFQDSDFDRPQFLPPSVDFSGYLDLGSGFYCLVLHHLCAYP